MKKVVIDKKGITIINGCMRVFDNEQEIKCYSSKEDNKSEN